MKKRKFMGYSAVDTLITSGTPTWLEYIDATDGSSPGDPSLDAFATGWSGYTPTSLDHCGIVDLGSGVSGGLRYIEFSCLDPQTFIVRDASGTPITGASPAWAEFRDVATDTDLLSSAPAISAVGTYHYKFTPPDPSQYCYGTIDLGSGNSPHYLGYISDSARSVINNFSPAVGDPIDPPDSITCDITDDSGRFTGAMLFARFPTGPSEVIYTTADGFEAGYSTYGTVTPITNGIRVVVKRQWNWHATPTLRPIIYDEEGKITP